MLGWRESLWFRLVALVVVVMMAGGFARVILGFALEAAEANRGAAVVAGAVLFGLLVRAGMRRFRVERPAPRHLAVVFPADDDGEWVVEELPDEPDPE